MCRIRVRSEWVRVGDVRCGVWGKLMCGVMAGEVVVDFWIDQG